MSRAQKDAILLGGTALATVLAGLLLPGRWFLIPAAALCALVAWMAARRFGWNYEDPDWLLDPPNAAAGRISAVCVTPQTLVDSERVTAELFMPFEKVSGDRFRATPGAVLLSAAVSVTEPETCQLVGVPREQADHWLRNWEIALNVNSARFNQTNPRVDAAKVNGFTGALVRDGAAYRVYLVGRRELARQCVRLLDGRERDMLAGDLKRLDSLPEDALCYASSQVVDGRLTGLTFLGAIRPMLSWTGSDSAMRAASRLMPKYDVCYSTDDPRGVEAVNALGVSIRPRRQHEGGLLTLRPRDEDCPPVRPFDAAVRGLEQHGEQISLMRLRALCFFLLPMLLLIPFGRTWYGALALILVEAVTLMGCGARPLTAPADSRTRWALLPCAPGAVLLVLLLLLLREEASRDAGYLAALLLCAAAALYFLWALRDAKQQRQTGIAALAVTAVTLVIWAIGTRASVGAILLTLLLTLAAIGASIAVMIPTEHPALWAKIRARFLPARK